MAIVVGHAGAADDMNIGARKGDIRSNYANLSFGINADKRTKFERGIRLDRGQPLLQRGVAGLQTGVGRLQLADLALQLGND